MIFYTIHIVGGRKFEQCLKILFIQYFWNIFRPGPFGSLQININNAQMKIDKMITLIAKYN